MLSARNQFPGVIRAIRLGDVMAELVVAVGTVEVVAVITRGSCERLGLKEGDAVHVVIKSTDVLVEKSPT